MPSGLQEFLVVGSGGPAGPGGAGTTPAFPIGVDLAKWLILGSGKGIVYVAPTAESFLEAMLDYLESDQSLNAMLPGAWWKEDAPPGQRFPMATALAIADDRIRTGGPNFIEDGRLQLVVYAYEDADARRAADRAGSLVDLAELSWLKGRLMEARLKTPVSVAPAGPGYGGGRIFAATRVFHFVYQGSD